MATLAQTYRASNLGLWQVASSSGESHYSSSGNGDYEAQSHLGPLYGTCGQNQSDDSYYTYQTSGSYVGSVWQETGSGTEYGSGDTSSSYSASGAYSPGVTDFSVSGSGMGWSISAPNLPHLGFSGSMSASGSNDNSYSYSEDYDLGAYGTWYAASGSKSTSNITDSHYSFSGSADLSGNGHYDAGTFVGGITGNERGSGNLHTEQSQDSDMVDGGWQGLASITSTSGSSTANFSLDYDQTLSGWVGGGQSVSNVHSDSTSTSTLDGFVLNIPTSGDGLQLGTSKGVGSLCFPHALCNFPGRKHRAISGPARWRCKRWRWIRSGRRAAE